MKTFIKTLLVAATIAMPAITYAGHHEGGMGAKNMPMKGNTMYQQCPKDKSECPMSDQMGQMGTGMGNMMGMMEQMQVHMNDIMGMTDNPKMKMQMNDMQGNIMQMREQMQQMHEHMEQMKSMIDGNMDKGTMMDKK